MSWSGTLIACSKCNVESYNKKTCTNAAHEPNPYPSSRITIDSNNKQRRLTDNQINHNDQIIKRKRGRSKKDKINTSGHGINFDFHGTQYINQYMIVSMHSYLVHVAWAFFQ